MKKKYVGREFVRIKEHGDCKRKGEQKRFCIPGCNGMVLALSNIKIKGQRIVKTKGMFRYVNNMYRKGLQVSSTRKPNVPLTQYWFAPEDYTPATYEEYVQCWKKYGVNV